MLSCARSQWFYASVYFALAGTFRSTGILLGGFILWGLIIDPFLHRKHVRF
jgi:phosphatidylinositol glycan class V